MSWLLSTTLLSGLLRNNRKVREGERDEGLNTGCGCVIGEGGWVAVSG